MTQEKFEELNKKYLYYEDLEENLSEKELDEYQEKLYKQPYFKQFEDDLEKVSNIPEYCNCDIYELEESVYMHYGLPIDAL